MKKKFLLMMSLLAANMLVAAEVEDKQYADQQGVTLTEVATKISRLNRLSETISELKNLKCSYEELNKLRENEGTDEVQSKFRQININIYTSGIEETLKTLREKQDNSDTAIEHDQYSAWIGQRETINQENSEFALGILERMWEQKLNEFNQFVSQTETDYMDPRESEKAPRIATCLNEIYSRIMNCASQITSLNEKNLLLEQVTELYSEIGSILPNFINFPPVRTAEEAEQLLMQYDVFRQDVAREFKSIESIKTLLPITPLN